MGIAETSPDRSLVLTKSVVRAADYLGLKKAELAKVIGLSPASVSRMYKGDFSLEPKNKEWELAALLVRLYRSLDAIMAGDTEALRAWMQNQNIELHGTPRQLIQQAAGLVNVVGYVDAHRARI